MKKMLQQAPNCSEFTTVVMCIEGCLDQEVALYKR